MQKQVSAASASATATATGCTHHGNVRRPLPHVLIVDDNPWIRETLTWLLGDAGYETSVAVDGVEALDALLLSQDRLVVVLDLLMPRFTGFDVLARVAADDHLATQHAYIVCSAKAPTAQHIGPHFAALLQRLDIPFIARPFDIDVLLSTVEEKVRRLLPEVGQRQA